MGDGPCNLETWMQMRRKRPFEYRLVREPTDTSPNKVRVETRDGHVAAVFYSLPHPADCGTYGGTCDC